MKTLLFTLLFTLSFNSYAQCYQQSVTINGRTHYETVCNNQKERAETDQTAATLINLISNSGLRNVEAMNLQNYSNIRFPKQPRVVNGRRNNTNNINSENSQQCSERKIDGIWRKICDGVIVEGSLTD